ncbi:cytochrome b ascorbate-dependent protein 3 [Striga asiatica]|uniref:Cytochrome b ascorbate-dependent protein 3 n=1 Tax=Striga asiatica TaxID=4170 RepID=A0A5A7RDA0_STRAF|nr:cytochrome b ascorbate-dependent protein 3 [Striga asiatica]
MSRTVSLEGSVREDLEVVWVVKEAEEDRTAPSVWSGEDWWWWWWRGGVERDGGGEGFGWCEVNGRPLLVGERRSVGRWDLLQTPSKDEFLLKFEATSLNLNGLAAHAPFSSPEVSFYSRQAYNCNTTCGFLVLVVMLAL